MTIIDRGSYPPSVANFITADMLPGEGWGERIPRGMWKTGVLGHLASSFSLVKSFPWPVPATASQIHTTSPSAAFPPPDGNYH